MTLVEARDELHALAEHVLAPARWRETGRIGLRVVPGGFATPPFEGPDGVERQVVVRGTELVVRTGDTERATPIESVGQAAAFAGIEPGASPEVYRTVTPLEPDRPLLLDAGAVREVMDWFALGNDALEQLRDTLDGDDVSEIQLWPEHFDVALTADRVNYGASPGDGAHDEPYVYVGPWEPHVSPFWNEPFGASLSRPRVPDVATALQFFLEGRRRTR